MVGVVGSSPIAPTNFLINIKLPDGAVKGFPGPVTVAEVAQSIGAGLARAALAGKVNGKLVDTSFRIESDAELSIVTEKNPEGVEILRHSAAHLLAHAVKELFPEAQVTIGPVIENGFFYDFAYKRPFTPEDLAAIEKKMTELAKWSFRINILLQVDLRPPGACPPGSAVRPPFRVLKRVNYLVDRRQLKHLQ